MGRVGSPAGRSITRAVFLDRDGVINRVVLRDGRPHPPASVDALEILPGVGEAVDALRAAGYLIIVVTNQPDVATGLQRREVVEAMHERVRRALAVDDIKVCYHSDRDGCECRKPKAGMLREAAAEWAVDLAHSFMIGDRWRDVEAGRAAGCRTIFIRNGYDERQPEDYDLAVGSVVEASRAILENRV